MAPDAQALHRLLDAYTPTAPDEAADVARVRRLAAGSDVWTRTAPLHVTASALVVHRPTRRVLLRWHERMQGWLQVGGHFDPGESDPLRVALREAEEETGLGDLGPVPETGGLPVQVVVVAVGAGRGEPAHEHADVRYVLETGTPDAAAPESEGAPVRWMTVDDAIGAVREENLRDLLGRAARVLGWRDC
jgi:8-oxo-dGTP pyrophosphatase MutT (NUDIX family)